MRYAQIRDMDITNGKGIGVSLFTQGCSHHCKNCFNKETWDFNGGKEFTEEDKNIFIQLCLLPRTKFISFLGGEPLDQANELYDLLKDIRQHTDKPIYLWSGYTYEQILKDDNKRRCLEYITYLIDGEFVDELKDLNLYLRGSSNQRLIDVQNSLKENKIHVIS